MKPIYWTAVLTLALFASNNQSFAGFFPFFSKKTPIENTKKVAPARYLVTLRLYPLTPGGVSAEELARLRALLTEHLSIIKKSRQTTLDAEQESILVQEAAGEINQIVATEGYFNSRVKITPETAGNKRAYAIQVGLAEPVRVKERLVVLSGPIEEDPDLAQFYADIIRGWELNAPMVFRQELWTDSKKAALRAVQKNKYPLAGIKNSLAQIDPNTHSALLTLEIDSGKVVYFGPITVKGAQKYPSSIVKNLAKFKPGELYQANLLHDYQNQLEQDGHYREAVVVPLLKRIKDDQVPILVYVKEQLKQSVGVELTYDSDEGPGTAVDYQYYNLFRHGYVGAINLNYNKYEQEISFGITQPRRANGRFLTSRINYYKGARNGLDTRLWSTGLWYVYTGLKTETWLGAEYYQEDLRQKKGGEKLGENKLLLLTLQWKINRIETVLRPENGYYLALKAGATPGAINSMVSAQRYEAEGDYYLTPWDSRFGTFLVRAQVGYISTSDSSRIPDELKFKLGGPNSVRGYATDKIGIDKDGYTLGGLAKVAATLEYQKPITPKFSLAIFHDVGDVKDRFKDMKLQHGTGMGVRWYSIAAPLSFDVAYGHERKKVGLYLSLGTRF